MSAGRKTPSDQLMDDYLAGVRKLIKRYGWAVQGVFPVEDDDLGFSYTVGLTEAGLTELAVSGVWGEQGQKLLNAAAKLHLSNEIKPGDTVTEIANVPFRALHAPLTQMGIANRLYGSRVRAVQLVWPEEDGSWSPSPRQELFGPPWWS